MATPEPPFNVVWDPDAVIDFEDVKSKKDRLSVHTAVTKLRTLGPDLKLPHTKKLPDHADLAELRPRAGDANQRPIYGRVEDGYVILAVAKAHEDISRMAEIAGKRAARYRRAVRKR